jgi:tetratricopeptide (TPR) repeat protein
MVGKLEILNNYISKIRNISTVDDLLALLKHVSEVGYESDGITGVEHEEGEILEVHDRLADAYDQAIQKIESDPNLAELKPVAESYKNIVLYWRKQASEYNQKRISEYLKEATEFQSQGIYGESISIYNKALMISPSDSMTSEILVDQGAAYFYDGQVDEALGNYDKAIRLNPRNARAWANIGTVLNNLGRPKDSVRNFEKAIDIDPNNAGLLTSAGIAMYNIKDYQKAKFYLEKAVALDNTLWDAWSALGAVYNDGLSDFRKSRDCFRRALVHNPDSLIVKANLAEILIILKEYSEVEPLLMEVINSTEKPVYGFVSRILLVVYICLHTGGSQRSFNAEVSDLLSYYESLPGGTEIPWCFSNLRKIVDSSDLTADQKNFLNSILGLKEKVAVEERKAAINLITSELFQLALRSKVSSFVEGLVERVTGKKTLPDIKIKDVVTSTSEKKGQYSWEVFLDAPDNILSNIEKVKYKFDATFIQREITITEGKGGFRLVGEGWGGFSIKVKIYMKNGEKVVKYHLLNSAAAAINPRQPSGSEKYP